MLYVSDLDGTLLREDATLSAFSRQVLTELLLDGLPFSVATARSVTSTRMILGDLPLRLPIVTLNGGCVSSYTTGRHEVVNSIEPEVASGTCDLIAASGLVPFVSTFDGVRDCLYHGDLINDGMVWYLDDRRSRRDPRLREVTDFATSLREQVVCLTVIGLDPALEALEAQIDDRFPEAVHMHRFANAYSPGWHWLTVHDRRATKGSGVRELVERSGLAGRELVVFGDGANDASLFDVADVSVAVHNAHGDLKARATHCIGHGEGDGVARFIREDWSRRRAP